MAMPRAPSVIRLPIYNTIKGRCCSFKSGHFSSSTNRRCAIDVMVAPGRGRRCFHFTSAPSAHLHDGSRDLNDQLGAAAGQGQVDARRGQIAGHLSRVPVRILRRRFGQTFVRRHARASSGAARCARRSSVVFMTTSKSASRPLQTQRQIAAGKGRSAAI